MTLEQLNELGAKTGEGMERCLNNEEFYLRMVGMALGDDGYDKLKEAIEAGDLDEAFERAHALKGLLANVSLTNLLEPVAEMTEELRARNDIDYKAYLDKMFEELGKLRAL